MQLVYSNILSVPRLNRYKLNNNDNEVDLLNNYLWNIKLAEAFYPALALFEVVLRNRIDYSISKNIKQDWLLKPNTDKFLIGIELQSYNKALNNIKKRVTKDRLISELNLGFWISLFKNFYNHVIWDKPNVFYDICPLYPKGVMNSKKHISPKIRKIHELRNKISHHEPIFDEPNGIDNCYRDLEQVIFWLSPEAKEILDKTSRFWDIWNKK